MIIAISGVGDVNGVDIFYTLWGDGNPLICLHGGMGVDSSYLRVPAILQLASRNRQVLIFDQRGHGRSGRSNIKDYSHARWVKDVQELAEVRGTRKFALMGHSYGGFIALEFAIKHPTHLTHLILVGTSPGPVDTGQLPTAHNDREMREIFRTQWPVLFSGSDKHWCVFDEICFSCDPYNVALHDELKRYDVRKEVRNLRVPTLLLAGSEDRYAANMRWLDHELPRSQLKIIPGCGHFPFLERPDEFMAAVESFLART